MSIAAARHIGIAMHLRRALLATSAITLVGAVSVPDAHAAQAAAANDVLEEIVVSARRVDENLQTTPISVTALSADFLKDVNVTRVQELSLVSPNLVVRDSVSNGMGSIVYMRGIGAISVQVLSDPPINIYVDGVVRARPTGNAFDLPDIERVEVLRGPQGTLFGRNTTGGAIALYTKRPTDEFGGSMEVSYGKFNDVNTSLVVNTGKLGNSNIRAKLTFQRHTSDGWVNTFGRAKSDWAGYVRTLAASFTLSADVSDKITVDNRIYLEKLNTMTAYQVLLTTGAATTVYNASAGLGGPPAIVGLTSLDRYYYDPRRPYDPYATSWGDTLNIAYDGGEMFQLKSISGFSGLVQKQTGQLGGSNIVGNVSRSGVVRVESVETFTVNNSNQQTQVSQEFQANGKFGDFNYTAGVYYFMEDIYENLVTVTPAFAATGLSTITTANATYTPKTTSYAAYANVGYRPAALDEKLELSGGLRYTNDKKTITRNRVTTVSTVGAVTTIAPESLKKSWNDLGWNASASYQFTPDLLAFVRGSSAFRSGAYGAIPGIAPVNPEEANSVEAGFKTDWFDNRLRLNGAFFKTWYDNLQINQRNAVTSVSAVVNAGKATFTGFDLEGTAILGRGFQINGSVGHVDPKYKSYDFLAGTGGSAPAGTIVNVAQYGRFPVVSHWTFNIGGQFKSEPMSWGVFTARMDYSYQGGYVFQPIGVIPAGVVQTAALTLSANNDTQRSGKAKDLRVNLTLSEIPVGTDSLQNVKIQLYGNNLTNHRYRLSVVDFGTYAAASFNKPRSYGIRLSAEF